MIERIHDDGEEYGISPKAENELQINYELSFPVLLIMLFVCMFVCLAVLKDLKGFLRTICVISSRHLKQIQGLKSGKILDSRPGMDFRSS